MDKLVDKALEGEIRYVEIYGKHDEDKPTGDNMATGSLFIEVDTGDAYFYERTGAEWYKVGG